MNILTMAIADAIAIASLCTLYMVRHRNRELMISYAVINAGIFTVSVALVSAGSNASAMGMGLFGVLSIIRLLSAPPWLLTPPRWAPLPQASSSFAAGSAVGGSPLDPVRDVMTCTVPSLNPVL